MTGLDLESFLLLLRADLGVWLMLAFAALALAFLVWSSWRSRRALRNCLVLSLAAHLGLLVFGSTVPGILGAHSANRRDRREQPHIREIRVATIADPSSTNRSGQPLTSGTLTTLKGNTPPIPQGPGLDLVDLPLALLDPQLQVSRPATPKPAANALESRLAENTPPTPALSALPKAASLAPAGRPPEPRALSQTKSNVDLPAASDPLPVDTLEIADAPDEPKTPKAAAEPSQPGAMLALRFDRRLRPDRPTVKAAMTGDQPVATTPAGPARATSQPLASNSGGQPATKAVAGASNATPAPRPLEADSSAARADLIPTVRATPKPHMPSSAFGALADLSVRSRPSPAIEIPRIYQPRLEPDRSVQAQRTGASAASELAVERAIDWLTRHQDKDGRWNAGTGRYADGAAVPGDDNFTAHCPPGETCFGECAYWEADTAVTGLALLTYLGAGDTHTQGRYADNVSRGLDYLLSEQKPNGDLRGQSRVVGMYCHAMATLALCEAYALSGDTRLRGPATRAVAFMVSARATDGMAWRYAPGAPVGDTSILGWVVMGLKSAREIGIPIPDEPSVNRGTLTWLDKVATGESNGLARYQPTEKVTPTMTAEAWVCRQFLGIGGPGKASSEAAAFLLEHESDRGETNIYYWYYATLALYQHGGDPWSRWNDRLRDKLVALQSTQGHQKGSWDPDTSLYGSKGGRIYCTALAALTLEVYYRYLRLYDEPKIPLEAKDEGGSASAKR